MYLIKMLMKIFILIVLSVYLLTFCTNGKSTKSSVVKKQFVQDSSNFTVIPLDKANVFNRNYKSTILSEGDLLTIDSLLKIFIADDRGKLAEDKVGHPKINFSEKKYLRQYVPGISPDHEKKVWVNCFCTNDFPNWHNEIVLVKDGGSCFFNLVINLTKRSYSFFIVNREA